ncbi:MAG: response regulator transcription factor [Bacteroidales bacterium]
MKRILIIEDADQLREYIAEILTMEGFEVMHTNNGLEGVSLAIKYLPDLILCDILMLGIDGYDVLRLIKSQKELLTVPLIFIMALSERDEFRKGMDLGADDYLVKPFTVEELLNAINSRIQKRQSVEKAFMEEVKEVERNLRRKIDDIRSVNEHHKEIVKSIFDINIQIMNHINTLQDKTLNEALLSVETRSTLQYLMRRLSDEIRRSGSDEVQKSVLIELNNKIRRNPGLVSTWTTFQLKFNLIYPDFNDKIMRQYPHLTQQDLITISAMYINLNTEQLSLLLGISPDSVRKFKYRLKKKLGLKKDQSLLHFIHSLG